MGGLTLKNWDVPYKAVELASPGDFWRGCWKEIMLTLPLNIVEGEGWNPWALQFFEIVSFQAEEGRKRPEIDAFVSGLVDSGKQWGNIKENQAGEQGEFSLKSRRAGCAIPDSL